MKGQLARSTIRTSVMLGLRVMTQAATLVLLTRLFGPSIYGDFAAISSLAIIFGTLPNLGAGYILLARGVHNTSAVADVWRYAWAMTLVLGLVLLAVYVPAATAVSHVSSIPVHILLLIGFVELLLTPITQLCSYALQSQERVPLSQLLLWLPFFLRLLAAIPCFWLPAGQQLADYAWLQVCSSLAAATFAVLVTRRLIALDWRPRRPTRHEVLDGSSYAAMQLIAVNPSEVDKVVALHAVGAHDAGIYSTTSRILGASALPAIAVLLSAQPRLFRHVGQASSDGRRLVVLIAVLTLSWGCLCALLLIAFSRLLPLLFGSAYEGMVGLMPWMALAAPFLSLRLAAGTILVAYGRPLERVGFEICGIATLISGMLILSASLGLHGLGLATASSECIMAAIGWWLVLRRLNDLKPPGDAYGTHC